MRITLEFNRGSTMYTLSYNPQYESVDVTRTECDDCDIVTSMPLSEFKAKAVSEYGLYGTAFLNRISNVAVLNASRQVTGDPSAFILAENKRFTNLKRKTTRAFGQYIATLATINA
jgi:hypothetical protein